MVIKTNSAILHGLQTIPIEIEISAGRGIPQLVLIGLASGAVDEAKERITSALLNLGIRIKSKRTIVNLAPADIKKTSSSLDLAIAVGLLKLSQAIDINTSTFVFLGELSLDGQLKPILGLLPLLLASRAAGFKHVVIPVANQAEVSTITGIQIHPLAHLSQFLAFARGQSPLPVLQPQTYQPQLVSNTDIDVADISGQILAKRALEISAAGGHHLFLLGTPGMGKTMLARALASILPTLTETEALTVTQIHSLIGNNHAGLITSRPFRAPHHSSSLVGLIGGGAGLKPGEISLAHLGVLFLDEVLEFSPRVLNALRQPLEDGLITLTRAHGTTIYPTAFTCVATANPCPCGYFGSQLKVCNCSPRRIEDYTRQLSGPLRDRFDLNIAVGEIKTSLLSPNTHHAERSAVVKNRVTAAFKRQIQRCQLQHLPLTQNGRLTNPNLIQVANLTLVAKQTLERGSHALKLSARGYYSTLKVALTIADLAGANQIKPEHVTEALQYRSN